MINSSLAWNISSCKKKPYDRRGEVNKIDMNLNTSWNTSVHVGDKYAEANILEKFLNKL